MTQSFDVFFDLHLNKRLSKQSRRRWFETPSRSLWRDCNVQTVFDMRLIKIWANERIDDIRNVFFHWLRSCTGVAEDDNIHDQFSIYGWARSQPMREDVTYITSTLIGWCLAQPKIENDTISLINHSIVMISYQIPPAILNYVILNITLRPRQDGRHFPDDIFQVHFREWKVLYFD